MKLYLIVEVDTCINTKKWGLFADKRHDQCKRLKMDALSLAIQRAINKQLIHFNLTDQNGIEHRCTQQIIYFYLDKKLMDEEYQSVYRNGCKVIYTPIPGAERTVVGTSLNDDRLEISIPMEESPYTENEKSAVKLEFDVDCENVEELAAYKGVRKVDGAKDSIICPRPLINFETGEIKEIRLDKAELINHGKNILIDFNESNAIGQSCRIA